jgi:hypothetical protein
LYLPLPSTIIHALIFVPWKVAINRAARAVFAEWDAYGFLFGVCDDQVWAILNTPLARQLRARPDFPIPADLQANAGPAARDVFKRATDSRAAWLVCSAPFAVAILDSKGESNRLAIADPVTDTLNLTPRDIINLTSQSPAIFCPRLNCLTPSLVSHPSFALTGTPFSLTFLLHSLIPPPQSLPSSQAPSLPDQTCGTSQCHPLPHYPSPHHPRSSRSRLCPALASSPYGIAHSGLPPSPLLFAP